jgi:hypothetical protein
MLICIFPREMQALVPQSKTTLNVSGFFLAAEYGDYAKGGWDFKA